MNLRLTFRWLTFKHQTLQFKIIWSSNCESKNQCSYIQRFNVLLHFQTVACLLPWLCPPGKKKKQQPCKESMLTFFSQGKTTICWTWPQMCFFCQETSMSTRAGMCFRIETWWRAISTTKWLFSLSSLPLT